MADLLDIAGVRILRIDVGIAVVHDEELRSEEHTSELQCQISYAVFCLKKKKKKRDNVYCSISSVILMTYFYVLSPSTLVFASIVRVYSMAAIMFFYAIALICVP